MTIRAIFLKIRTILAVGGFVLVAFILHNFFFGKPDVPISLQTPIPTQNTVIGVSEGETITTALMGNGCFWCAEADFEKLSGVLDVVSGYAGGTGDSPTYKNYAESGHREVVEITYDSSRVGFGALVEYLI
ncbi:MAG: peptide-methionine (S)-S-oxide reductase, partial [Candidatus Taylorbacteria bacterium]|nr:peptide-methionine (S)-S-oxide reductase [Candidatus Taylorbacteria bacterium]